MTKHRILAEIMRSMIEEEGLDNNQMLDWLHSTAACLRYDVRDVPNLEDELLNMIRVLLKGENE